METKEQKIERLKKERKKIEYNIEDGDKYIKKQLNFYFGTQKMWRKKIKQKEQQLKELEGEKTKTYSEEPTEIEGLEKFLTLRRKFEKTIDNAIEDYFKDKPKIIRCFTFSMNTNHWVVITEDYNAHDIIVVYKDNKFQLEFRQVLNFEKQRNKFITNFCKEMKLPRWLIEG